jgi:putative transposase
VQGIKSGYYIWVKRPPSERQIENRRLEVEIEAAHRGTRGVFGPHRQSHGIKASLYRIRTTRRNLNLRCKSSRQPPIQSIDSL